MPRCKSWNPDNSTRRLTKQKRRSLAFKPTSAAPTYEGPFNLVKCPHVYCMILETFPFQLQPAVGIESCKWPQANAHVFAQALLQSLCFSSREQAKRSSLGSQPTFHGGRNGCTDRNGMLAPYSLFLAPHRGVPAKSSKNLGGCRPFSAIARGRRRGSREGGPAPRGGV